ncbi:hypothetical protein CIW51_08630 [Mycolicibacterium sp. P9-22]|nr:hypothetical protein CIW51_08630 [Mycolicibacterium sp. P9-22]
MRYIVTAVIRKGPIMSGVLLGIVMVLLGAGSIAAVVAAAILGYGTIALAIGIVSSAAFAAKTV